ncbi:protein of unknown function (plasmid) [Escherichia coli]|nr:protein of unknown function [Escherichia coli]
MLRRSNYHDTLAEFFQLLKRERIKKSSSERGKTPPTIFLNIEMFYNNKRRHGSCEQMSTIEYKTIIINNLEGVRLPVAIQY